MHRTTFVSLHWLYFIITVSFGLLFVLTTPPNAAPDEAVHEVKIVRVASGNLFGADNSLPLPDVDAWYGLFSDDRMDSGSYGFNIHQIQEVTGSLLICSTHLHSMNDNVAAYSPLLYVGQALTYNAACSLGARFGTYLYSARVINLLLAAALITLGVSSSQTASWPLVSVGLLPSVIYQISSISADAMLLGLSMLCIGVTVGTMQREFDVKRGFWTLAGLAAVLSFSKPGYYWLSWLPWLCYPVFREWGLSRAKFGVVFVALPLALQLLLLWLGRGSTPVVDNVDPTVNLAFLARHPWDLLLKLVKVQHVYPRGDKWNLFESLIGKLGWLSVSLPPMIYTLALAGLILALFASQGPVLLKRERSFLLAVGVASAVIVAAPLYLYATPQTDKAIFGLQGRYFIPSLICCLAALTMNCPRQVSRLSAVATVAISVSVLAVSLGRLVLTYYG